MEDQQRWVKIISPVWSQLKFRPPYTGGSFPRYINYLYGHLYHGIWAPASSTESRLVTDGKESIAWDTLKYESQLFYFNVEIRENIIFDNPLGSGVDIDPPELLNNFDDRAETQVWIDYLSKVGTATSDNVIGLSRHLTIHLNGKREKKDWLTLGILRQDPLLLKKLMKMDEK